MPKRTNEFQELVTLVQRALAPKGATVTASALVDVPGQTSQREIDVLIESGVGPYRIKIAVEARDTGRKMDQTQFEGLLAKYQSEGSIKVNKLVIVTHHGFFEPVIERAQLLGNQVELLSYRQAKNTDWAKMTGMIRFALPPHLCHFRFDPPVDGIKPNHVWKNGRIICRHGHDHGTPESWSQMALQKVLADHPTLFQELSVKAQAEPSGQALGNISFPMDHTLSLDGKEVPLQRLGFAVHVIDGNAQMEFTGCEITKPSGETSFIPMAQAEVGGKKLQFVFPEGFDSKQIVLKIDTASVKERTTVTIDRPTVVANLRDSIQVQLNQIEQELGMPIQFESLASEVRADFGVPNRKPRIRLRADWQDVDVAHELTHAQMELLEGYNVLGWLPDGYSESRDKLVGWIRSYTDDEIVHSRLLEMGLSLDGEILSAALFQTCDDIASRLRARKKDDGFGKADGWGKAHGSFYRAIRFVQASLLVEKFGEGLAQGRLKSLGDFLEAFRKSHPLLAHKGDTILEVFHANEVTTVAGHAAILKRLCEMEGVSQYVGLTAYQRQGDGYILPMPA